MSEHECVGGEWLAVDWSLPGMRARSALTSLGYDESPKELVKALEVSLTAIADGDCSAVEAACVAQTALKAVEGLEEEFEELERELADVKRERDGLSELENEHAAALLDARGALKACMQAPKLDKAARLISTRALVVEHHTKAGSKERKVAEEKVLAILGCFAAFFEGEPGYDAAQFRADCELVWLK